LASGVKRLISWTVIGLLLLAAVYAVVWSTAAGHQFLTDARRTVRVTLGLPKIWVREYNVDLTGHTRLPCPTGDPIVIVTGGQSNAANSFDPVTDATPVKNAYMFFDGHCFALRSPVLGATSTRDSLWPRLGAELVATTRRPVVFINGAVGGSQLGDWLDDRSLYRQWLLERVRGAAALGMTPDLILWIQGETDAATRIKPSLYVDQMRELIRRFGQESPSGHAKWVLYRSTRCGERPNNGADMERALTEFTDESSNDRIHAGPRASSLDNRFRRDQCHFNSRGRDWLVDETMKVIVPLI
jgi:hypothetical protein